MAKKALVTGVTGQDGSYLAEHLLELGYEVHGLLRHTSNEDLANISHVEDRITLHSGDLLDQCSIQRVLEKSEPEELYNLGAMSFVPVSWEQPVTTGELTALGTTRMLEAIRTVNPKIRYYQASSSEMFGKAQEIPQKETTPFYPRSPYGISKVYAHWMTVNYRESYDLFAVSGILFNHESPRRGLRFVTRKVTDAVARIKLGRAREVRLGNLEAKRDWGYAGDYVKAMHRMLQAETPRDYVIATGETHSVQELCEVAFAHAGLDWREHVVIDKGLLRPAEVNLLIGDASKAERELGWVPQVRFKELIELMVDADMERHRRLATDS